MCKLFITPATYVEISEMVISAIEVLLKIEYTYKNKQIIKLFFRIYLR